MKKRKILNLICCFALVLCSTLMFAACGFTNPTPGYESGSSAPEPDEGTKPPSSGDDSEIEIDDEGGVAGGEIADFSDYFNGYVVLSNGDSTFKVYDEVTKTEVTFNDLLDRQIDVLAQQIIYGLTYVYGYDTNKDNREQNQLILRDYLLNKEDGVEYKLNNNNAVVNSENVLFNLTNPPDKENGELLEVDIDSIEDFQESLIIINDNNYLNFNGALSIVGAIEGRFMTIGNRDLLSADADESKAWKMSLTPSNYLNYSEEYKEDIKLGIIKAIYGEETTLGYNQILDKINNLGFYDITKNSNQINSIVNFIYENIIGQELVNKDNEYANYINNNYNGIINDDVLDEIQIEMEEGTFTNSNNPRFYKGYNVVVPAIVSQAINNTFQGTEISLYPTFARVNGGIGKFDTYEITNSDGEVVQEMTTTGPLDLNSIILMPKQGSKPIALNLQVAVARDLKTGNTPSDAGINDLTCYAHDVVVELEVNITYKVHGQDEPVFSQVIQPDGEDSATLTIDSKGYVPTYIDYEDPNFDPTRVDEEGYLDQFKKPMETNGEILPFTYIFSIYDYFPDDMPAFNDYDGYNPEKDINTLFNNKFQKSEDSVYLDAGPDYVQFTFNIKSIKQYSGDGNQLVDYSGDDIVFDIALMPYTF